MSRLIDADALIKKFNDKGIQITFDLPVEEILGEDVDIDDFSMLVQDAVQAYRKMVIDMIQEQPTAYDVEKVVEQLEETKKMNYEAYKNAEDTLDIMCYGSISNAYGNAIEIVRKGGVK